ncbi:unnamed protein product [Ceratitis capitata]|uniref:(Mediterranean fruit fly) hypothetical protein n=1 Tax=Ceratitis capitata TaxID=7213 RepID=A0A811VFX9_CERCA|nr:unnamed protein product [Ceratitis capitata]
MLIFREEKSPMMKSKLGSFGTVDNTALTAHFRCRYEKFRRPSWLHRGGLPQCHRRLLESTRELSQATAAGTPCALQLFAVVRTLTKLLAALGGSNHIYISATVHGSWWSPWTVCSQ